LKRKKKNDGRRKQRPAAIFPAALVFQKGEKGREARTFHLVPGGEKKRDQLFNSSLHLFDCEEKKKKGERGGGISASNFRLARREKEEKGGRHRAIWGPRPRPGQEGGRGKKKKRER